ncbi:MAG TPA: tetraacyldisaccharide 4'-kinase [Planctomycetota bacterium]|nr:tetraacyldisaccharide 4'-kinase [Planctomycetota bacterium]
MTPGASGLSLGGRRRCIDRAVYLSIISGERRGLAATLARAGLRAASWPFGLGVAARSGFYAALGGARAGVPVISIGNLTTGGTGKTPLTIALAERLVEKGEKVAVLARGYGAERDGERNEELELVAKRVPAARIYPGRDRIASAARAEREGATAILLDDGFQHRKLARDVDILIIDATDPWGGGHLLPRGLLREPVSAVSRADAIVLSRVDLVSNEQVEAITRELRAHTDAPIAHMRIEPVAVIARDEPALEALRGARVVLVSGIGNPRSFESAARALGAHVVDHVVHEDHRRYTRDDVAAILARAKDARVLTTEKDMVKLASLVPTGAPEVWALRVGARLEQADELLSLVHAALEERSQAQGSAPRAVLAGGAP